MSRKNRNMSDNNGNSEFTKRLVVVTGDKGGVGKSTLSRALLHFYTSKNIPCIAFECDTRNPQLERHFKKYYRSIIGNVNFFNKGGSDTLIDDIDENNVPIFLEICKRF
jgi:Mrp family chromosome partitioning ATPase